jgi:hypothetical protein
MVSDPWPGFEVTVYQNRLGRVAYLEYECGQTFPGDPMIGVRFTDGATYEFWREELTRHIRSVA